jgi:hypothetical protein
VCNVGVLVVDGVRKTYLTFGYKIDESTNVRVGQIRATNVRVGQISAAPMAHYFAFALRLETPTLSANALRVFSPSVWLASR